MYLLQVPLIDIDSLMTELTVTQQALHSRSFWLLFTDVVLFILVILVVFQAIWYNSKRKEKTRYARSLEAETLILLRDELVKQIRPAARPETPLRGREKEHYQMRVQMADRVQELDLNHFSHTIELASGLSMTDKRYLMCFAAGLAAEQVAEIFSVSPSSVYTVRYRIRKKFPQDDLFVW